ncbi:YdcF family protein [Microbacterium sp. TNHR37B]|uniref:YdcF family protein n=1 Tax=Microbacterium sp. TNHR37B TaxID=1775956 RepID=UPI0007B2E315|nr:YdcF family protein [Microbacterium sp. TNHR37B]KZE88529.1 hypothetical protein AVP41_03033 [Microbacterium sp. TNHR37B]
MVGAAAVLVTEAWSWRASRQDYPERPESGPPGGEDVVLVLGFPPRRDGAPGILQRWRTRIALRSAPPGALFVFTGAAVRSDVPEADVMADLARGHGIPDDRIVRERTATTTRENLARSLPWLETARTIRIASNTFHARRARRHLRERHPGLFVRLRPTRDFRPFEVGPFRPLFTAYDAIAAAIAGRRDREAMPGASAPEAPR